MRGWAGGTLISKGFGYPEKIDYRCYEEYALEVPTVILDGYESGSSQGWGYTLSDDVIIRRKKEIIIYKRVVRNRRWIEFNGKKVLCDEEDVPKGYETLDFEEKNEFSITVYDLENKTKCVYYVKPEKEYVPYKERDIEKYINMTNENLYPNYDPEIKSFEESKKEWQEANPDSEITFEEYLEGNAY